MSFVSAFITKDFASIMSDGQITGENKKAVQEDYKKIIKVNNFLIGFTGNSTGPVDLIKKAVGETDSSTEMPFLSKEILLLLIKELLNKYRKIRHAKIHVVVIGFNEGEPSFNTISLDNSEIYEQKDELEDNGYRLITLYPSDYRLENKSEGNKFIEKIEALNGENITLYTIKKIQNDINNFVADNSNTANKHIFSEYVKNGRLRSELKKMRNLNI